MLTQLMLILALGLPVKADVLLDEIKVNLDDSLKKVEEAKSQIRDLEENDLKLKKNIEVLDESLNKKLGEQKQAKETSGDYNQKLTATGSARKEFERSLVKDRQELELVERDLKLVEKKIDQLKAARKALIESIEISQDNLSKMNDRSSSWQKNKDQIQNEINSIDKEVVDLEKQKDNQQKVRTENQQALNKWKKTLATQEATYQKLDSRYRQAVRDAERREKEKKEKGR